MGLFDKKEEKSSSAGTPIIRREDNDVVQRAGDVQHTLISRGSEFEGKLSFEGQVRIEGKFSGQIHTKDTIIVGESGKVTADIVAGTVISSGTIEGTVKASQLIELHAPGRVKGTLETPALSIEKGVVFEGQCKMEGGAGKAAVPPPTPIESAKK